VCCSERLNYQDIIVAREVSHETRKAKGAKYSHIMDGDAKSSPLNKLTKSVTLLTHFVGARTPVTLTESFHGFIHSLFISF